MRNRKAVRVVYSLNSEAVVFEAMRQFVGSSQEMKECLLLLKVKRAYLLPEPLDNL